MDSINSTNNLYGDFDYQAFFLTTSEANSTFDYDNYEPNISNCIHCHCSEDIYIYYIDGITLLIVAVFGIIGTIMSMIVLLKPRICDFFSYFLIALSMFDCSFLIMAIMYIGLPAVSCK